MQGEYLSASLFRWIQGKVSFAGGSQPSWQPPFRFTGPRPCPPGTRPSVRPGASRSKRMGDRKGVIDPLASFNFVRIRVRGGGGGPAPPLRRLSSPPPPLSLAPL